MRPNYRSFNQSTTAANTFEPKCPGRWARPRKACSVCNGCGRRGSLAVPPSARGSWRSGHNAGRIGSSGADVEEPGRVRHLRRRGRIFEGVSRCAWDSQTAALEATGTFGNLFSAIGIVGPQASAISQQFVKLAADMASFNNASPEDVLLALRSGLTGEVEPLRRYGVLLSEARVQQEAMAKSGKTSAKELTNQEKALARIAIIMRDTATAQGDFARTSGSLANQQRILDANVQDLKTSLGSALLRR